MVIHRTIEYGHSNVDKQAKMGQSRISTRLDIASSQQHGTLIHKAGVLQGNIFTTLGYGMLVDERLGA